MVFKKYWHFILFLAIFGLFEYYMAKYLHGGKQQLKLYKYECFNDSTPAFTRIVSNRYTLYEAQQDSLRMSASNINVTYSIGKSLRGIYADRYQVKETSTVYNHREPTLVGFETYLKK